MVLGRSGRSFDIEGYSDATGAYVQGVAPFLGIIVADDVA